MSSLKNRLTVVILTCNRAQELRVALDHVLALDEQPAVIVVDNCSVDGTPAMVRTRYPDVELIESGANLGAAARNLGVHRARTPYVAFSDDDSWWAPGALSEAVRLLDAHSRVAAVGARILLGPEQQEDPVCRVMAESPLPAAGLPGPSLLGFIACAVVFRREAFLKAGGYEQRFFVGGEEALLSLDLASSGWHIVYAGHLVVHHHPSPRRDRADRHRVIARNAIWVAWLRLPVRMALAETLRMLRYARHHKVLITTIVSALAELPWLMRERRVITPQLSAWYRMLQNQ